jgi:von Willebrand factor
MSTYVGQSEHTPHPCTLNLAKKEKAIEICNKLTASVFDGKFQNKGNSECVSGSKLLKFFSECNWLVDHETFYEDCMYDVCACHADPSVCACPVIASYAAECARQGNVVDWRQAITECGKFFLFYLPY